MGYDKESTFVRLETVSWALREAPVSSTLLPVLLALAAHAQPDGTAAYPAIETIAWMARKSEKQVRRDLHDLLAAGLIRPGDESRLEHLRGDRRPAVYDLMMSLKRGDVDDLPSTSPRREREAKRSRERWDRKVDRDRSRPPVDVPNGVPSTSRRPPVDVPNDLPSTGAEEVVEEVGKKSSEELGPQSPAGLARADARADDTLSTGDVENEHRPVHHPAGLVTDAPAPPTWGPEARRARSTAAVRATLARHTGNAAYDRPTHTFLPGTGRFPTCIELVDGERCAHGPTSKRHQLPTS